MWLPKDERRLLAGYYRLIGDVGVDKTYRLDDLRRLLGFRGHRRYVPEYGASATPEQSAGDFDSIKKAIGKYIQDTNRIRIANKHLAGRSLIVEVPHQHDKQVIVVSLTLDGYDLGRKYSGWFQRSGLRFEEYRNHWMWLILACLGAAIVVKLIDLVARLLVGG